MRSLLLLICLTITLNLQAQNGTIEHDGITRDYILHLPSGYDAAESYPLVFNLHGFGSNAGEQVFYSGMDAVSDDGKFIVCYPNGVDNSWNVGWIGGSTADDVDFINVLIDSIAVTYSVNLDRVYSCGMSNGGFMSYKLACDLGDKIAAIASVTGSMVPGQFDNCNPYRKTPVMQIHGTEDPVVPYNGMPFIAEPIEDVIDFWLQNNGCEDAPVITDVDDANSLDGCTAERYDYTTCEEDSEFAFYKIDGGGHTWPGAIVITGVTNQDFRASEAIWEFFNRFDLNGAIVSSLDKEIEIVGLELSPNPAFSSFLLKNLPLNVKEIAIIDAFGRTLKTLSSEGTGTQNIDVSSLPNGVYFVRVKGENSKGILRFVKS